MRPVTKRMHCNTVPTPTRPPAYKVFKGCTRKQKYATEQESWQAVDRLLKYGKDTNPSRLLLPYRCEVCFQWHVGHANPDAYNMQGKLTSRPAGATIQK
jgi:hypothetical protein